MISAPARHSIKLRGAGAELAQLIDGAIERGERPPDEFVVKGRAGTGKSYGIGGALLRVSSQYPQVPGRVLILRLTRNSITSSTCVTLRKILHPADPTIDDGRQDENRTHYRRGAWIFQLGGLNNIDNLLSTEWDFVWVDECRQIPLAKWEELASRGMRNYALYLYDANGQKCEPGRGVSPIPFGMCIGTTNPWMPKTWFNLRAKAGKLRLVTTTLEENPAYYDDDGEITPMGTEYEQKMRATLPPSSPRFRRLVLGEDCGAEGMIYEEFVGEIDAEGSNMVRVKRAASGWIERDVLESLGITEFYAGVDFGDDDAGCLVVAGLTKTRTLIVVAEVYARRKDLDWWEQWVRRLYARYQFKLAFCDHNRPDWTRAFNDYVGAPHGLDRDEVPGQVFIRADKADRDRGIQLMRLRIARKTLLWDIDALAHPPQAELVEAGLPACTVDEIPGYVYKRTEDDDEKVPTEKSGDKPDPKSHDHGCDATRYLVVGVDYVHPADSLPRERDPVRLRRLMGIQRRIGGEYREPFEYDDSEDVMVDRIRGSLG